MKCGDNYIACAVWKMSHPKRGSERESDGNAFLIFRKMIHLARIYRSYFWCSEKHEPRFYQYFSIEKCIISDWSC